MGYEIASPLSQQVLEERRRLGELGSPNLYPSYRVGQRVAHMNAYRPARFGVVPNDVVRCHPESLSVPPIRGEHEEGL